MADHKLDTGLTDRSRISINSDEVLRYCTDKFEASSYELTAAIAEVGNSAQSVATYLGKPV